MPLVGRGERGGFLYRAQGIFCPRDGRQEVELVDHVGGASEQ